MITLTKFEWATLVVTEKLQLLSEIQTDYKGFKVNENSIYALNKAGNLVAFYNSVTDVYVKYDKPLKNFSKTKRKFKICKL